MLCNIFFLVLFERVVLVEFKHYCKIVIVSKIAGIEEIKGSKIK